MIGAQQALGVGRQLRELRQRLVRPPGVTQPQREQATSRQQLGVIEREAWTYTIPTLASSIARA